MGTDALSILKVTFDPGGSDQTVILDFLQRGQWSWFPWNQQVDVEPFIAAANQGIFPRGNTSRTWQVVAITEYASFEALALAQFTTDAAIPQNKKELHVRILDLDVDESASEASRTYAHYKAAACAISGMDPQPGPKPLQITRTWTLQIGPFVVVP